MLVLHAADGSPESGPDGCLWHSCLCCVLIRTLTVAGGRLKTQPTASSGGLGLVIVQRILQLHGSEIQLVQLPDKGAVFRFQLFSAESA